MATQEQIPVLLVSGFLGSGKTSLLRQRLTGAGGTAVIVNEFGEIGLDHHLLRACEERVELVGGGCACCLKRTDLVHALRRLLDDAERGRVALDRVVIETSGLADPAPIVFTIVNDPMLRHHFAVDSLVVTVDAVNATGHLTNHPVAAKQIMLADEIVITKVDMVEPDALELLRAHLAALNPGAAIRAALHGVVREESGRPPNESRRARRHRSDAGPIAAGPGEPEHHTADISQLSISPEGPLDWLRFAVWLSMLIHSHGEEILRVKGLLELTGGVCVSVNTVQHVVHRPLHVEGELDARGPAKIVFITRGLNPERLRESFDVFQRMSLPTTTAEAR